MKKIFVLFSIAFLLVSCGKKDPVAQAIETFAMKDTSEPYSFKIYNLNLVDSTSFGVEIDRRIKAFQVKVEQNTKLYNKYMSELQIARANQRLESNARTSGYISELEAVKTRMGDSLKITAYYDYVLSAKAKVGKQVLTFDNVYVTVTPQCEVLGMAEDQKAVHKSAGKVIPGYVKMLKGGSED